MWAVVEKVGDHAFLGLICCLCWPWIFYEVFYADPRQEAIRAGERRSQKPPKSLLRPARRAITPHPGPDRRRKLAPNSESALLRLPLELRLMIWKECLGGNTIHLGTRCDRKFSQKRILLSSAICDYPHPKFLCSLDPPLPRPIVTPHSLLSILLTCRQVYSEAIQYLYTCNTFDTNPYCVEFLPRLILPQRLNSIRNLQLLWELRGNPPYPPLIERGNKPSKGEVFKYQQWVTVWKNIAEMQGLVHLRVELKIDLQCTHLWRSAWNEKRAREMLAVIREVKAPTSFQLVPPNLRVWRAACKALRCEVLSSKETKRYL